MSGNDMEVEEEISGRGVKRKHESDNFQENQNSGNTDTPTGRRIEYDFWGQRSSGSDGQSASKRLLFDSVINVSDIQPGRCINQTLEVRCTLKMEIKNTPSCKVFTFHGMDETGEITFVAFREVAEKFNELIEVNKLYRLDNFTVKPENSGFRSITGHDYQVEVGSYTSLEEIDIDETISKIPFEFVPLNELASKAVSSRVDVIGIVVKDFGLEGSKRQLLITDMTKESILVSLWRSAAEKFSGELYEPLALRNAVVVNYMNKTTLNSYVDTLIWTNPDVDNAASLVEWFKKEMGNK